MNKRHRIFIAISLPNDIKKYLADFKKKWRELPANWVSAENLHITLVFFGDLTDEELGEVCMVVKEAVKNHNSFDVNLNNVGYGPDEKIPPRFIWTKGEKVKELSLLKNNLENSLLEKIHFVPEGRGFVPHATLAKISAFGWRAIEPEERPEVDEIIDLNFTVESIEVMESESVRGNLRYTVIESHQLR